jgi:hypothetical protein
MRRALILLVAGATLLAGCDDEDSDPRADFLKQADRICLRSGIRPKAVPNDLERAAGQLAEESRLRAGVHEKLERLEPPDALREDYARFLDQTDRVARGLDRMAALARAGRDADLGELGRRTGELESQRFELGKRIGFRRCGRPITDPVRSSGGQTP